MGFAVDKEQKKVNELEAEIKKLEAQKAEFMDYFAKKQKACEKLEETRLETLKAIEKANKDLEKSKKDIQGQGADVTRETQRLKELRIQSEIVEKKIADERTSLLALQERVSRREEELNQRESRLNERKLGFDALLKKLVELAG